MPRCFAEPCRWTESEITLGEEEARHLSQVLRFGPGQTVTAFDGNGRAAQTEIMAVGRKDARLKIVDVRNIPKPHPEVHLLQALLKSQKMDLVIQKAVELGAASIHPVQTRHGVVKIKTKQAEEKVTRWNRIAVNAAKQCGANWLTGVEGIKSWSGMMDWVASSCDLFLVGALRPDATPLPAFFSRIELTEMKKIGVLIGPEGDFSPEEYEYLAQAGAKFVSLGDLTLRAETATIYTLSILSYELSRCMIGP